LVPDPVLFLEGVMTMPDQTSLSLAGALVQATANQARMANSVMHLFKVGFNPSASSTLADFLAAECDFDGYAPATIAAWGAPVLAGVAWATYAPTQTFRWTHVADDVGNAVGGHFLVTAAGDLMDFSIYDPSVPAQGPGQAVIKTPIEITPAGVFF
jgi:hypothetical protein